MVETQQRRVQALQRRAAGSDEWHRLLIAHQASPDDQGAEEREEAMEGAGRLLSALTEQVLTEQVLTERGPAEGTGLPLSTLLGALLDKVPPSLLSPPS